MVRAIIADPSNRPGTDRGRQKGAVSSGYSLPAPGLNKLLPELP